VLCRSIVKMFTQSKEERKKVEQALESMCFPCSKVGDAFQNSLLLLMSQDSRRQAALLCRAYNVLCGDLDHSWGSGIYRPSVICKYSLSYLEGGSRHVAFHCHYSGSLFTRILFRRSYWSCTKATMSPRPQVFPYSLPIVGPGADPGVQAVSPQVT